MTPAALVRSVTHDVLTGLAVDPAVRPATVTVERPRDPEHGDYATYVALQIGKVPVSPRAHYAAKAFPCSVMARWTDAQGLSLGAGTELALEIT